MRCWGLGSELNLRSLGRLTKSKLVFLFFRSLALLPLYRAVIGSESERMCESLPPVPLLPVVVSSPFFRSFSTKLRRQYCQSDERVGNLRRDDEQRLLDSPKVAAMLA